MVRRPAVMATDLQNNPLVCPTEADFEAFREKCLTEEDWKNVLSGEISGQTYVVYSKKTSDTSINIIRSRNTFTNVNGATLYDVLHDREYRMEWDEHMIEGYLIEMLDPHTEVGYYHARMPTPVSNRDFCNLRSWRHDSARNEYIIFNYSVRHEKCPEYPGVVRARSFLTGFFIQETGPTSCDLIYYTHVDPKGWIPSWLINYLTVRLPPKLIHTLYTRSLEYNKWKGNHHPEEKPWWIE